MKKVLSMILALAMIAALVVVPVSAAEQNVFYAYDAFELKNSSTEWSFQHATIGQDDYSDLEFIESGWFHEFYQNWAQGAWPYGFQNNGKRVNSHPGMIADAVMTFTAPRAGNLQIPKFTAYKGSEAGDGTRFQILKNDMVIFPEPSAGWQGACWLWSFRCCWGRQ